LGNLVSYEKEKDTDNKITKCLKITGLINNTFKPNKFKKNTRIKLHNTLALPVLLYGSENWIVKSKYKSRLTAAGMRFTWNAAKYTWRDYKTNEEISKELRVTSVLDKITSYKGDWIQHVNRLPRSRLPNSLIKFEPRGIRNWGRQLKRLMEE
jgi:hypothetical protein